MGNRLLPLRCGFNDLPQSDTWAAIQRGLPRALRLGFYVNGLNNCVLDLIVLLLVFLMNHLPTVKNGGQTSIHHCWRAPK
jgi:hypothetical protein